MIFVPFVTSHSKFQFYSEKTYNPERSNHLSLYVLR